MIRSKKRCAYGCSCDDCIDKHVANSCDFGQQIQPYKYVMECTCVLKASKKAADIRKMEQLGHLISKYEPGNWITTGSDND